ncbi:MAG: type IV pilin protein [Candidatus Avelusimicrobium sp.]|uniref:type IV pilin protein n=1 Tax=Candidatus Avelusimicrobium sp. TaxID=3048833 RepID=UPI003EFD5025
MYQKRGFTLIELLVVVLIIGILSAVALPQYTKAVEKSRAVQAVVLVKSIRDAAEIYYMANGTYPSSIDDLDIERPAMVKDFEWDNSGEWKDGRFSLRHTSDPDYYIIASGAERTSSGVGVPIEFLKGKVYCSSSNTKGLQVCKSIGSRNIEGAGGKFWEL